jgi:hypothetical protein
MEDMPGICQGTRPSRTAAILLIVVPILVKLHLILGLLQADPLFLYGGIAPTLTPGWLPGWPPYPTIDPNIGFTSQALGHRVLLDVLGGRMPWWNYFEGVGAPLAGEMQSAAFFPLTLLFGVPGGQLYFHIALQVLGGLSTYFLARRLDCSPLAAFAAALLFEFNGTFAWLACSIVNPIPFLPMALLGVEATRAQVAKGKAGGWAWIAAGIALSLYAGFPEVAYLDGFLITAWVCVRVFALAPPQRCGFMFRIGLGLAVGLLLAAPILIAFLDYLPEAWLAHHTGDGFGNAHLGTDHMVNLFFPYLYGLIFQPVSPDNSVFWGMAGGYVGLVVMALAVAGAFSTRHRTLRLMLLAWVLITWAATYGAPGAGPLVRLIPAVGLSAHFRYFAPSWEFALTMLAALALQDQLHSSRRQPTPGYWWGLALTGAILCACFALSTNHIIGATLTAWFYLSAALGGILGIGLICLGLWPMSGSRRACVLAGMAMVEAVLLFLLPTFSYPKNGNIESAGVRYLQSHLGNQRFYSLGPISPNYGSYFGIAEINHNDLPVPRQWANYVVQHLDDNLLAPELFVAGVRLRLDGASAKDNFLRNRPNFLAVGVRYVVAPPGTGTLQDWQPEGTAALQGGNLPVTLNAGGWAEIRLPAPTLQAEVSGIAVLLGNYRDTSDGALKVEACTAEGCAQGSRNLTESTDNNYFSIPLSKPLGLAPGNLTLRISHVGGRTPVALWVWPSPSGSTRTLSVDGLAMPKQEPKFRLELGGPSAPAQVFGDKTMSIFELTGWQPYFSADGCQLQVNSREALTADCPATAQLKRLELFMPGWTAVVNGLEQPIEQEGELFQRVDLPAGHSTIEYRFRPPFMVFGYLGFVAGLLMLATQTGALSRARSNRVGST